MHNTEGELLSVTKVRLAVSGHVTAQDVIDAYHKRFDEVKTKR